MKTWTGLTKAFIDAKVDELTEVRFNKWKEKAQTYYEGDETIWQSWCKFEYIPSDISYENFCLKAKETIKERMNSYKVK